MSKTFTTHWGQWVIARSELVGFKRQQDLARAVGCQRERIVKWSAMANPPRRMRKGFDRTLARALGITLRMLFTDYKTTSPESLARIMLHRDHAFWSEDGRVGYLFPPKVALERMAKLLTDEQAEKAVVYIAGLMLMKQHRRAEAEKALAELGLSDLFKPDFTEKHEDWLEENANEPLAPISDSEDQPPKKRSKSKTN